MQSHHHLSAVPGLVHLLHSYGKCLACLAGILALTSEIPVQAGWLDTTEKRLRMRETREKLTIKFISKAYMHYKMMNIKTKPQNLRSKTSGIARRRLELLFYVG